MPSEPKVLLRLVLGPRHRPTGNTRHYRDGRELPAPQELRIAQYPGDPGFYLLFLDDAGEELTDT